MNSAMLLRSELADVELRTLLRRVVRRRVPAADVEDIVQAAFCDALAALARERVPSSAPEVRRWLVRIAANKAVDHFRQRRRDVAKDVDELPAAATDADARVLLARAVASFDGDHVTRHTLDLALREADGESYAELARGEGTTAAALRQRVSRFRRLMTSRWLVAATLAALVAASWTAVRRHDGTAQEDGERIHDDVDVVGAGGATDGARSVNGTWRVTSWAATGARSVLPPELTLEVHQHTVRLAWLGGGHALTVLRVVEPGTERETWQLAAPAVTVHVVSDGTSATATVGEGPWAGTATLVRVD